MNKVVRDGKVAVLISNDWGAGFYSWGAPLDAIFDPALIDMIENTQIQDAIEYVEKTYPGTYTGGIEDLTIYWIPEGTKFLIMEYDGNESLLFQDQEAWITA
jgi:hypothetical protein